MEQKKGFLSHVLIITNILFWQTLYPYTLLHFVMISMNEFDIYIYIIYIFSQFFLCKDNSYEKIVRFFSITFTKVWNIIVLKCVCITSNKYDRSGETKMFSTCTHCRCIRTP